MKRVIIIALICFAFLNTGSIQQLFAEEILKGVKEKIETQYNFEMKFGEPVKEIGSKYIYKYSDKGLLIEDSGYNSDGEPKWINKYNDKGLKIEKSGYELDKFNKS